MVPICEHSECTSREHRIDVRNSFLARADISASPLQTKPELCLFMHGAILIANFAFKRGTKDIDVARVPLISEVRTRVFAKLWELGKTVMAHTRQWRRARVTANGARVCG